MINLALSPLMSFECTIEKQLEKTVQTLNKLIKSIHHKSEFVLGITWLLVDKFIENKETRIKLSNILSDNMEIIRRIWSVQIWSWRKKGMKKGIEKNKVETAEKLLKRDLSMKFVSEITDIPTRELETIYKK